MNQNSALRDALSAANQGQQMAQDGNMSGVPKQYYQSGGVGPVGTAQPTNTGNVPNSQYGTGATPVSSVTGGFDPVAERQKFTQALQQLHNNYIAHVNTRMRQQGQQGQGF